MGPKGAWISSRRANSRSASSGDKTAAGCAAPALAGSPRPALAASHQATRHRIDQHRCITPRYRYAYKPDTDDRRRAIVRADSPDSRSAAPPSGHLADEPETRTHPPRSPQPGPSGPPGRTPSDRRPPPAACSAGTGRHELQIRVHQPFAQAVTDLARPRHQRTRHEKPLISATPQPSPRTAGNDTDHPGLRSCSRK